MWSKNLLTNLIVLLEPPYRDDRAAKRNDLGLTIKMTEEVVGIIYQEIFRYKIVRFLDMFRISKQWRRALREMIPLLRMKFKQYIDRPPPFDRCDHIEIGGMYWRDLKENIFNGNIYFNENAFKVSTSHFPLAYNSIVENITRR